MAMKGFLSVRWLSSPWGMIAGLVGLAFILLFIRLHRRLIFGFLLLPAFPPSVEIRIPAASLVECGLCRQAVGGEASPVDSDHRRSQEA